MSPETPRKVLDPDKYVLLTRGEYRLFDILCKTLMQALLLLWRSRQMRWEEYQAATLGFFETRL